MELLVSTFPRFFSSNSTQHSHVSIAYVLYLNASIFTESTVQSREDNIGRCLKMLKELGLRFKASRSAISNQRDCYVSYSIHKISGNERNHKCIKSCPKYSQLAHLEITPRWVMILFFQSLPGNLEIKIFWCIGIHLQYSPWISVTKNTYIKQKITNKNYF